MEKRPRILINLTLIDYFFEIIGAIGMVCLILLPVYYFNDLQSQMPKHFNTLGQVDSYRNRGIIWLLPAIGMFLYVGLSILNKFPFAFNYPTKVTNENAEKLYTPGTRTIRLLKLIVILLFAFLNFKTLETGLNRATEVGKYFLAIFLIVFTILMVTMIYKMTKK
ncbi:DUF1648 domain-containing protein [Maribellus maritimus]|uniref:DUF1648 domain-containing protein n=1 Tax=Maribellus maritimus TaxID=2870838 RepID=UPI001EEB986E|nr:DUF1648 domain-containing protein [Maribellus maritimus]MCG6187002.1 DUF1648 domain-containing protein [Maribellus maritimus]